jgi:hypothetical protein
MPRKRKTWSKDNMILAIKECREKRMGYFKSAKTFKVPQSTLERYVKMGGEPEALVSCNLGRKPVFSSEMDNLLAQHCLDMEQRYFGITRKDVCRLAFTLCKENGLKNPFNSEKECAGSKWLKKFFKRNPQLSFRTPQGMSYARIKSFTPENVNAFFNIYEPELSKIKFNPNRIFNCDETGITILQHKHPQVVARKGKKQEAAMTSAERGSLINSRHVL